MGTKNVSFQVEENVVAELDEFFEQHSDGAYSRSAVLVDAMEMYLAIHKALEDAPDAALQADAEREKRFYVRQAVLNLAREDMAGPA